MPGFNAKAKAKRTTSSHAKGPHHVDAFDGCAQAKGYPNEKDGDRWAGLEEREDDEEWKKQAGQGGEVEGVNAEATRSKRPGQTKDRNQTPQTRWKTPKAKGNAPRASNRRSPPPPPRPAFQIHDPPKPSHSYRLPSTLSHPSPKGFQFRIPSRPFPAANASSDVYERDPIDELPIITFLTYPTSVTELKEWTFVEHVERLGMVECEEVSDAGRYTGKVRSESGFMIEFGDVVFRVAIGGWGVVGGKQADITGDQDSREGHANVPLSKRAFKTMLSTSIGSKSAPPGFPFKIGPPPKKSKNPASKTAYNDDQCPFGHEDIPDLGSGNGEGWHTFDRYPSVGEMLEKVVVEDIEEVRVMIERTVDTADEGSDEGGYKSGGDHKGAKAEVGKAQETTFKVYRATFGILEFGVTIES